MKYLFFLIILFFFSTAYTQTLELEKNHLNSLIKSGKLNEDQMKWLGKSWSKLLKDFNGYPDLPYNSLTNRIEYVYIDTIQGMTNNEMQSRVKEWVAINYGSIKEVLHYEDKENGKLIVKGFIKFYIDDIFTNFWGDPKDVVRSLKCYYTTIFTIKENRIKTEFTNIDYKSESGGYMLGTTYVPIKNMEYSIIELYPVTLKEEKTWVSRLSTLENTTTKMELMHESIISYIINANHKDNNF